MLKRVGLSLVAGVLLSSQGVDAQVAPQPIATIAQAEGARMLEGELTTENPVFEAEGTHYNNLQAGLGLAASTGQPTPEVRQCPRLTQRYQIHLRLTGKLPPSAQYPPRCRDDLRVIVIATIVNHG